MELRIIDAGAVSALRSQSLWHGIASAMTSCSTPTLSFCRPTEPYVGLGYHRSLQEVDQDLCRARALPVIRRQIGGGPVYLDEDQLFFQVTLPVRLAPARVRDLYEVFLQPAVDAFRTLGLDARLRGINDIAVDERKVSGTGAGQIGEAVTVVGNVLFRFSHERMTEILALPNEAMRHECLRLMRRHVSSLEAEGLERVTFEEAKAALERAYAKRLGWRPAPARLTGSERKAIERWERRLTTPSWLAGAGPSLQGASRVKICEDVWVVGGAEDGLRVQVSLVDGRVESAFIEGEGFEGAAARMSRALAGLEADAGAFGHCLQFYGEQGGRVLKLLEPGLPPH